MTIQTEDRPAIAAGAGPAATAPSSVPRLPENVSLQILDEAGLLFDAVTRQLYALNTTATFIWCQLEAGLSPAAIRAELQRVFGFGTDAAAASFATALLQWREAGLLDRPAGATARTVAAGRYRLLDLRFRLQVSPPHLQADIASLLAPLADDGTAARDTVPADLLLEGRDLLLRQGGRIIETCRRPEQLLPMLKTGLVRLALENSQTAPDTKTGGDLCAFHAAGIVLGRHCLLLAGASGSGKSTLTATLAADGHMILGDDTIVLAPDLTARPMPFAICLKPGAWRLLQPRWPMLEGLPAHRRLDGKRVRYLLPPDRARWPQAESRWPVGWIVFPRRVSTGETGLVRLGRAEALGRLMGECCPLGAGLDTAAIARLVDWIRGIACYELRFDGPDDALARLRGLEGTA